MNAPVIGISRCSPVSVLISLATLESAVLAGLEALDRVRGQQLDVRLLARPLEHDLRGAKLLAAMHDGDLAGELREEDGLLHRRVPATDDHGLGVLEEGGVARGAVGDATAAQLLLAGHPELLVLGPHCEDHGTRTDARCRRPRRLCTPPGSSASSTRSTWSVSSVAPKRSACSRSFIIKSGPMMPSGKPG